MERQRESSQGPGADERGWLSLPQLVAVAVFLVVLAGLVFWTTTATSGPFPDIHVDSLVPPLASVNGAVRELNGGVPERVVLLRAWLCAVLAFGPSAARP